MNKKLSIFFRGTIIGFVSTAIPGINSATVSVLLGIYQMMINSISDVFTDFKKSFKILFYLLLGFLLGAFCGALSFETFYHKYPIVIVMLVIGLLLGGLPKMLKSLKSGLKSFSCWLTLILTIFITNLCVFVFPTGTSIDFANMISFDYILLFFAGFLTSVTIAIPGIDYAILLLTLGYYHPLLKTIAELGMLQNVLHNVGIIIIYGVGYLLGLLIFAHAMKILTQKFQKQTAFASFAYILAAPFCIVKTCVSSNTNFNYNILQVGLGLFLGLIGFTFVFFLPKILGHIEKEEDEKFVVGSISESSEMYSRRIMKMPQRVAKVIFHNMHILLRMIFSFKRYGNVKKYSADKRHRILVKYINIFHNLAKVEVVSSGLDKLPKDLGAACFMGNHQGMDDPLIIMSVLKDYPAAFLANSERASNFLVDAVCDLCDSEKIDVYNIRSQLETYNRMEDKLCQGTRYVIFPEAWYSDNKNTLLEFHTPCFVPAMKTQSPIIPFCLYDSWKVFEDQGKDLLVVECHILDPIFYDEYHTLSKKELAVLVKSRIQGKLNELNAR